MKYRIKTIKLKKQISQGIVYEKSILKEFSEKPLSSFKEGMDVTGVIGVDKYEPAQIEDTPKSSKKRSAFVKFLMQYSVIRFLHKIIFPKRTKDSFPKFLKVTDETRLQSCPSLLYKNLGKEVYYSEKLDGQSATYFYNKLLDGKRWGIFKIDKGLGFGVCSREKRRLTKDNTSWWTMAVKHDVEEKLRRFNIQTGKSIAVSGEIVGPGIQENKYKLKEYQFFVYSVWDIDDGKYVPYDDKISICKSLGLPVLGKIKSFTLTKETDIKFFIGLSQLKSFLNKETTAEGIVCRLVDDDNVSFKVISPNFLLSNGE